MLSQIKIRLKSLFHPQLAQPSGHEANGVRGDRGDQSAIDPADHMPATEHSSSTRLVRLLEEVLADVRYGGRGLVKRLGFTMIVVITIALGIGANTAVFSLVDAFLLRLLPVKEPQQLYFINIVQPTGRLMSNVPREVFEQIHDQSTSFSGLFAFDSTRLSVTSNGQSEIVDGDFVSGNYFDVLGVGAVAGRTFDAHDDRPDGDFVAVISYSYWERRFAKDPTIVGRTVLLGDVPVSIIGVTPPGFFGRTVAGRAAKGGPADLVLPMFMQPRLALRDHTTFQIMGRLKPEVRPEAARDELAVIYQQAMKQMAGSDLSEQAARNIRQQQIALLPGLRGSSDADDSFAFELRLLLAVVGIVLLLACVNVANLLLARAAGRRKEVAIRLALGASRARLIRQLLTENVLLAVLGGALGLLLANWGVAILLSILSYGQQQAPINLTPNAKVLAFTVAVTLLTGICFGLAPALATTRVNLVPGLKGNESGNESGNWRRVSKLLVISQVSLSLVLLIGAGLLVRTLGQLHSVDTGFEREKVLTMWAYPSLMGYDYAKEMRLYHDILEEMNQLPGVEAASLSRLSLTRRADFSMVSPGFFETMGIDLLQGHDFTAADTDKSPRVAIISESMARRLFPNGDALGQHLPKEYPVAERLGLPQPQAPVDVQVIGIVKDIKYNLRQQGWEGCVYIPYTQALPQSLGQMKFLIRTRGNPASLISIVRTELQKVDQRLALREIQTQMDELDGFFGEERSLSTLLSIFGGMALVLASIGLYGTMAHSVTRRTQEIGIRMALGAQRRTILWIVLRETLVMVASGIVIGLAVATAATRLISSMLFGVKSTDPLAISVAIAVMLTVALLAGYLPSRRAMKVDPMQALRYE
ncbi:MAG TPA: ABC transporter permease [Blastocatellia bacterium]|nr:ABC transporter permease [Blastocatellia bacterium]